MKSKDISSIIEGWEYKPDEINVRKITGDDGVEKVQMRLELGLLQMEIDGRPDGKRPHGHESLFAYYEYLLEKQKERYKNDSQFLLTSLDCQKLRQEAIQYYHRYLSLFQLEDYEKVMRDTARNLRLLDFIKKYSDNESDRLSMEQYRPYIIMMYTRSLVALHLERKEYVEAESALQEGISKIRDFLNEYSPLEDEDQSPELSFLKEMAERLKSVRPMSPRNRLERELEQAIEMEDFERAAEIRDELNRLES